MFLYRLCNARVITLRSIEDIRHLYALHVLAALSNYDQLKRFIICIRQILAVLSDYVSVEVESIDDQDIRVMFIKVNAIGQHFPFCIG